MEREITHFSHEHSLFLKAEEHTNFEKKEAEENKPDDHPDMQITCYGCPKPISGPFYSCKECCTFGFFLHKECAELPNEINHPMHLEHPLTLLTRTTYPDGFFNCDMCNEDCEKFVYSCSACLFDVDVICALASHTIEDKCYQKSVIPFHNGKIQHFSHVHPLSLKAEGNKEHKTDDGTIHLDIQLECNGCLMPISGPFYSCKKCGYFLHKVCAELPNEINHPMHLEHPLTLLSKSPYSYSFLCIICRKNGDQFVYSCSKCLFDVDIICASASLTIKDICHQHPLTPLQLPISFPCNICQKEEKGLSYRCNICPFWAHQNCAVLLTESLKHSHHDHLLTLMQSVPFQYGNQIQFCDICHDRLYAFHCVYSCVQCTFFAHASCAQSETTPWSSLLRDQNTASNQDLLHGSQLLLLPPQPKSTALVSWFIKNYIDRDINTNNKRKVKKQMKRNKSKKINDTIDHFDDRHLLFLVDRSRNQNICKACAAPITTPSYGCIECDYFLHECCAQLPEKILHPFHLEHKLSLLPSQGIFFCRNCYKWCNGFLYTCLYCEEFGSIDIKCASLVRPLYHIAHKHPLNPKLISSRVTCSACRGTHNESDGPGGFLQCDICSFITCIQCAMSPPIIEHRWDKHPFVLTFFPPEHHYENYYCLICEGPLNLKCWFYHCSDCDQFAHVQCMVAASEDSNIIYGKSYKCVDHEHVLTLIDCTYNNTCCDYCLNPLKKDYSVGLECKPCDFNIHLDCLGPSRRDITLSLDINF